jgi:hypothetical protein
MDVLLSMVGEHQTHRAAPIPSRALPQFIVEPY